MTKRTSPYVVSNETDRYARTAELATKLDKWAARRVLSGEAAGMEPMIAGMLVDYLRKNGADAIDGNRWLLDLAAEVVSYVDHGVIAPDGRLAEVFGA